ncbi:hypothetical protein HMF8227_01440 [Saliniradius amylolyticus]|uniref:DUF3850 domain-containing protein n=1 Tax=Saliniradius amylolyticus TaxID=2183582 RepID=A0A2S2E2P3_9ALTE|nr:DUF3850 domain-containing protein [Saliniradius amylolyticus]AWL11915.1 hypothetical protein HMF8227_01440 [Saliniradius amylolyticus]
MLGELHTLCTKSQTIDAIRAGHKRALVVRKDRHYCVGDLLDLRDGTDRKSNAFAIMTVITDVVTHDENPAIAPDFCWVELFNTNSIPAPVWNQVTRLKNSYEAECHRRKELVQQLTALVEEKCNLKDRVTELEAQLAQYQQGRAAA